MNLTFLYFLSNSKIQKYSPTESAKVYEKAVNKKSTVHFNPRQTLDFISNNIPQATLTNDIKKRIVKQYLDVSSGLLNTHLWTHSCCFFPVTFSVCNPAAPV